MRLERRQGLVLAVNPQGVPDPDAEYSLVPGDVVVTVPGPWQASAASGKPILVPCPGNWAQEREWETFAGTLCFRTEFDLTDGLAPERLFLDLGPVGDIAEVFLNGQPLGVRAWEPYVLPLEPVAHVGQNTLEVRVTNSIANALEGSLLPSGLLGPVSLRWGVPLRTESRP